MENPKDQTSSDKARGSGGDVQSKGLPSDSENTSGSKQSENEGRQQASDSAKTTES